MNLKNYFKQLAEGQRGGVGSKVLSPALSLAAFFYGRGVRVSRALREKKILKQTKLPFPVVSVGNITWGGTGKTPLVEYLARKAVGKRKTPLILTRGYSQDEVEQMKNHLPRAILGVGKDRAHVAKTVGAKYKIDLAILDDGLQHGAVHRDVDIVTINCLNPFGNEKLIPKGILREPLSALKRASILVLTHVNLVQTSDVTELMRKLRTLAPQAKIVKTCLEPLFFYRAKNRSRVSVEKIKGKSVATFAAVGAPRSFQRLLQGYEIKTPRNFEFLDHHPFQKEELEEIGKVAKQAGVDEIVTTEKDYYRSKKLIGDVLNPLVLATRLRVLTGEDILSYRLFRSLGVK